MPGIRLQQKVRLEGPVFTPAGRAAIGRNIEAMLDDVSSEMEGEVQRLIAGRAGSMRWYTGWTTSHVRGRTESLGGRNWHRYAVVSPSTSGQDRRMAIRTMAAASTIERRWHPFRRVSAAARKINRDMAKGLN